MKTIDIKCAVIELVEKRTVEPLAVGFARMVENFMTRCSYCKNTMTMWDERDDGNYEVPCPCLCHETEFSKAKQRLRGIVKDERGY